MSKIRNLPLAVRLAGAFGALTVAMAVVAFTGVHAMSGLSGKASQLADRDLAATELLGNVQKRAKENVALTEQHLYVYDGDLANEDRIAQQIQANDDANAADTAKLASLLGGSGVADELKRFEQVRAQVVAAQKTAVARSRQETVDKADDRDGSRNFFMSTVLKDSDQLGKAGDALIAAAHEQRPRLGQVRPRQRRLPASGSSS